MREKVVIEGEMNLKTPIDGELGDIMVVDRGGTKNHSTLFNRDKPDQHPIDAVTELRTELDKRPNAEITPQDIDKIIYGE